MLRPLAALAFLATGLPCQPTEPLDAAFARIRPKPDDARWTLIPWRESLSAALAESKREHKPVYLFVNDGDVDSGRC